MVTPISITKYGNTKQHHQTVVVFAALTYKLNPCVIDNQFVWGVHLVDYTVQIWYKLWTHISLKIFYLFVGKRQIIIDVVEQTRESVHLHR